MSRNLVLFCAVGMMVAINSDTTFAQCDASPRTCCKSNSSCGCSAELNACGDRCRLFKPNCGCKRTRGGCDAAPGCNTGCRTAGSRLANIGRRNLCNSGCDSGCNTGCENGCDAGCGCGSKRRSFGLLDGVGRCATGGDSNGCCDNGCGCQNQSCGRSGGLLSRLTGISGSFNISNSCGNNCDTYIKGMVGLNFITDEDYLDNVGTTNDGFLLGWARGRRLNNNTRFEFESSWRNNSGDVTGPVPLDGHINVFSPTVNLYRDLGCGPVRPYIGGGIGVAYQDAEFTTGEIEDWAFAFQAAAGITFSRRPGKDWFIEYRYYGNTKTDVEFMGAVIAESDYEAENLIFGFRERF